MFFGIATSGGNQALYKAAPTREKADALLDQRLAAPFSADANDVLYQWDSSRDYNPSPGLEKVQAAVLAINAADDERNPPELGLLDRDIEAREERPRAADPGEREDTLGHGTTGNAAGFYWRKISRS